MTSRDVLFQGHVTIYEGGVQIYFRCLRGRALSSRTRRRNQRTDSKKVFGITPVDD